MTNRAEEIAAHVGPLVREIVSPYEINPRIAVHGHGPSKELVVELRGKAREAGRS
jgi:acyl-CoA dehydrogenase